MNSCDIKVNGEDWHYYASLGQTRRIKKSTKKRSKPWTAHLEYSLKFKELLKLDDVRVRIRYGDVYAKTRDECIDQEHCMIVQFMKDVEEVLLEMKNSTLDLVHLPRLKGPSLHRYHFQQAPQEDHCTWFQDQMNRCRQREADENPCSFCLKEKRKLTKPDFNDRIVRSLFVSQLPNTRYQQNLKNKIKISLDKDNIENKPKNPINNDKYWMKSYEKEEEEKREWRHKQKKAVKTFTKHHKADRKQKANTEPNKPFGRKSKRKTSPIVCSEDESEYHSDNEILDNPVFKQTPIDSDSEYSSDDPLADRAPIPKEFI